MLNLGIFFWYEIPQIKFYKWNYLKQDDNLLDLLQLLLIVSLVGLEAFGADSVTKTTLDVCYRWLLAFYLMTNLLKLCYFGRYIESLQHYLYIIKDAFKGLPVFSMLLIFFSLTFSLLYKCAGIDTPGFDDHTQDEDFPGMPEFVKDFMYAQLNTFGDTNLPGFNKQSDLMVTHPVAGTFMVVLALLIFFWQFMSMVVVLMNLLIALISERYEKAREI